VERHADELALLETLDMGKPISDVLNIDLPEVLQARSATLPNASTRSKAR
jgi:4-guanidinobutyraldehyde dehydrogenase/NAD-dependent aldehyde dehydrogenase